MKYRSMISIALAIFIVLCIGLIGAALIFLTRIPAVETQVFAGSTPVHIDLTAPVSQAGWPLNSYIPLQAEARGGGTISTIELYINGQLYQKVNSPMGWTQPEYATSWNWRPGTTGFFILIAKATNSQGATGISDPVRLEVIDAAWTVSPYLTKEGETLESIADNGQVNLSDLKKANPTLDDPSQILPIDITIKLPNPPELISNDNIISGFPVPEPEELIQIGQGIIPGLGGNENNSPQKPVENSPEGFRIASYQDLKFWMDQKKPDDSISLPMEPVISAKPNKCTVTLNLNSPVFYDSSDPTVDKSHNESGFFVYRSQDGKPFERIATLPAITNPVSWEYYHGYTIPDQFGAVTFTISAFNTAGETTSAPVTLQMDQDNCLSKSRGTAALGQIHLTDGNLILPYSMDLAYLYMSINNTRSYRIPEGDRMFLPGSGMSLNLDDYFDTLLGSFTAADFDISMEVWGWIGADLKFVGTYKTTIHRSVLLVCSEEGEGKCSGNGDGEWVTEINFSDQKPVKEQTYMFKWISSQIQKTDQVCYQFADSAYPNDSYFDIKSPIESWCGYIIKNNQYTKSNEEITSIGVGNLLYPTEKPEYYGWGAGSQVFDYHSNGIQDDYQEGSPFSIYVRVQPKSDHFDPQARFSNTVVLHRDSPPVPSELPPLASPFPSLYTVEILRDTYIPPTFESADKWGCVIIVDDPTNPANNGKEVCPPPLGIVDDCEGIPESLCLLQGLGNSIVYVADFFLYGFNMIKWEMTEVITSAIPYCHDYDKCYSAVHTAVEEFIYYASGIPPNTETTEDAFASYIGGSMISTASEYTKDLGISADDLKKLCGSDCQKKIGIDVIQGLRKKQSFESQKACSDAYQAYFHNKQAMCLDPSILVTPAEGGGNYPAGITVKVTRKDPVNGQEVPPDAYKNHKISINVTGSNDFTAFGAGYTAQLYAPVVLPVTNLEPGESMVLNTKLQPCGTIGNKTCGVYESWEGMKPVYYNGKTEMEATEMCYSPGSSWDWVPCATGGYDSWQFDNPLILQLGTP